jgi:hypothetical protein
MRTGHNCHPPETGDRNHARTSHNYQQPETGDRNQRDASQAEAKDW